MPPSPSLSPDSAPASSASPISSRKIPGDESAEILRAYLLDAVPGDWRHAVTILVEAIHTNPALEQATAPYRPDSLSQALEALRSAAAGDIRLAKYLIDSASTVAAYFRSR